MTRKVLIFILLILVPQNLLTKCKCADKEIKHQQNTLHFINLEACNFQKRLSDFELFVERRKILLWEWENCLNNFETYINSIDKPNKIISSKYRFLRWLNITNKKLTGYKRLLDNELKQIEFEYNFIDFHDKLNLIQNYDSNNIACETYEDLVNKINLIQASFINSQKDAIGLINKSIQFKAKIKGIINSGQFEACCCWY